MDKMPKDIMVKAEAIYDALGRGSDADAQVIARAILAERRRCAEVAEARAEWVPLKVGDMRAAIEAGA